MLTTFETLPRPEESDLDRDNHGQRGVAEKYKMNKDQEHFLLYVFFLDIFPLLYFFMKNKCYIYVCYHV